MRISMGQIAGGSVEWNYIQLQSMFRRLRIGWRRSPGAIYFRRFSCEFYGWHIQLGRLGAAYINAAYPTTGKNNK